MTAPNQEMVMHLVRGTLMADPYLKAVALSPSRNCREFDVQMIINDAGKTVQVCITVELMK